MTAPAAPSPSPSPDLDPRLLLLPPSVLIADMGLDLSRWAGREMPGGCRDCDARTRLLGPGERVGAFIVPDWLRLVFHRQGCTEVFREGPLPGAYLN